MKIYTPEETAELLKVTPRTVYTWLRSGRLLASRPGRRWLIEEDDIRRFLTQTRTRPGKPAPVDPRPEYARELQYLQEQAAQEAARQALPSGPPASPPAAAPQPQRPSVSQIRKNKQRR